MRQLSTEEFAHKSASAGKSLAKVLAAVYPVQNPYIDSFESSMADAVNRQIPLPEHLAALTQEAVFRDLMRAIEGAKENKKFTFRHPLFKDEGMTLAGNDFALYGQPPQIYVAPDAQIALGKYFEELSGKMPDSEVYFNAVKTLRELKIGLQRSASLQRLKNTGYVLREPEKPAARPAPLFDAATPTLVSLISEGKYEEKQASFIRDQITLKVRTGSGRFMYNGMPLHTMDFHVSKTGALQVAGDSAQTLRKYFTSHKISLASEDAGNFASMSTKASDAGFYKS
jgi:hypothetical protein